MESRCRQRSMEMQWPRTRQAALNYSEPHWAPAGATLGDWMCSQTCWGYWAEGWFEGWHKIIKTSSAGQPLITPSPHSKVSFVARREICHGHASFSHRHYKSRAAPPFPLHLKSLITTLIFASFLLIRGFTSDGGFSYWAKFETQQ